MHLVLQCISCTWLVLNLVLPSDHSLKPLDSCKPGLLVRKSEPGKKSRGGNNLPKVVRRHLCLWETILSRNQGFLVGSIQDFPGFKIDGYTRIGQTFQHHHIQINPSASVYEIARRKWLSQCNGLFTEGGKVLTGRFHYRILFDHRTEKRNTEAKALFFICSAIATKLFVTRCRCIPPFLVSKWKLFQNNHWVSSDRNGNFKSLKILRRRSQPGIASCEVVKFSD